MKLQSGAARGNGFFKLVEKGLNTPMHQVIILVVFAIMIAFPPYSGVVHSDEVSLWGETVQVY